MQQALSEAFNAPVNTALTTITPATLRQGATAPIDQHRLFRIEGPDTERFLQGQSTCDIKHLTRTQSLSGAFCTPKGRAYSLFRVVSQDESAVLIRLPAAVADEVVTQLQKYLMLFKAEMTPADDWMMLGATGEPAIRAFTDRIPEPDAVVDTDAGYVIGTLPLPDGTPRAEVWLDGTARAPSRCVEVAFMPAPSRAWTLSEILAGLTTLNADTASAFVPQNLNLHATNAISFNKGCYTGQEVVARMHFLGELKKSLFRLEITNADPPPVAGDALSTAQRGKVGSITDAIQDDEGTTHALAVLSHSALENGLSLAECPAASVQIAPMGYEVPEQTTTGDK